MTIDQRHINQPSALVGLTGRTGAAGADSQAGGGRPSQSNGIDGPARKSPAPRRGQERDARSAVHRALKMAAGAASDRNRKTPEPPQRRGSTPIAELVAGTDIVAVVDALLKKARGPDGGLQKRGSGFVACCPFHEERTPSFHVFEAGDGREARFHCFGACPPAQGHGNVVKFVSQFLGVPWEEALDRIEFNEIAEGYVPGRVAAIRTQTSHVDPFDIVPDHASPLIRSQEAEAAEAEGRPPETVWLVNPRKLGRDPGDTRLPLTKLRADRLHPYRTGDGQLVGYVVRSEFDEPANDGTIKRAKITPMVCWARFDETLTAALARGDSRGRSEGWTLTSFRDPRPIYRGETITGDPNQGVLVVEGEKTADVVGAFLEKVFPPGSIAVVSWAGGTNAPHLTDWSPLRGKAVHIWPDADDGGHKAAKIIAQILLSENAFPYYIMPPSQVKKGWDGADAVDHDHWNADDILTLIRRADRVTAVKTAMWFQRDTELKAVFDRFQRSMHNKRAGDPAPE